MNNNKQVNNINFMAIPANDDAAALYAANETVSERVNAKSVFSEYKCESSVKAMFNTDGCSAISHPGQISEAMGLASVKLPPSSYPVCNLRPNINTVFLTYKISNTIF